MSGANQGTDNNASSANATTQKISRWRLSTIGSAHSAPGSQTCGCKYRRRNARPRNNSVAAMNQGRSGSSAVRLAIHAPPMPSASSTNGPTQHTDAPIAASAPATSEPLTLNVAMPG
jgi:hypothetical protein